MRKLIISLVLLLSTSLAFGQKYQGDLNFSFQIIGYGISTSHGVSINNHYIGAGVESGFASFFLFDGREWAALYADYRHIINIGKKGNSIFVQVAPGFTHTSNVGLFTSKDKDGNRVAEIANCLYAKVGVGFQWNYTDTGLSLGLYCTYFGDKFNHVVQRIIPSMGLTFHW